MKKLYKYLLIGLLGITFTSTTAFSQNIDANRMNRDIKIMENILGELFKTQNISTSNQAIIVDRDHFFGGGTIRGTYLPGFGIIFKVGGSSNYNVIVSNTHSGSSEYSFYYDTSESENSDEDRKVTVESVTERVTEFLKDYGSTIGQLKDNEKIMVIYGSKNNSSRFPGLTLARGQNQIEEKKETLPVISVSAKVSDLKDYRTGKINESKFGDRLAIATSKDKEYLDLKVMGNIFETALRDQESEAFRLSGSVNHLMLDNFGALFSFDVRYSNSSSSNVVWGYVQAQRTIRSTTSVGSSDKLEQEKEELDKAISNAYSNLLSNIKEYVVDYGRTLSSLGSDQFLLLSITINGRHENIPGRLDIQVKKSVLEQLDKGSISRDQAIQQVVVTEY